MGIDDLVGAVANAVRGCGELPTPTPTPTPRFGLACGGAGQKPCGQLAAASPRPCGATALSGVGDTTQPGTTVGGDSVLGGVKCGTKGGGNGAPERVRRRGRAASRNSRA